MKSLVEPDILLAIQNDYMPSWCKEPNTRVTWVNWRDDGAQIKFNYNDCENLEVYVDFKAESHASNVKNRDIILKSLFAKHSPQKTPFTYIDGHEDWSFKKGGFISPNEAVALAKNRGFEVSVIYRSNGKREMMGLIGLPIVAGEAGKEWENGEYKPYAWKRGMNL